MKISSSLKIFLNIFGFILFFLSFLAFLTIAPYPIAPQGHYFTEKQSPLYGVKGISVDSRGFIYACSESSQTIQIFDDTGIFLYQLVLPTDGEINFFIDDLDVVHVLLPKPRILLAFKDRELLTEQKTYVSTLKTLYPESIPQKKIFEDTNGNLYKVNLLGVSISSKESGQQIRKVILTAPIWPFSAFGFWMLSLCGLVILYPLLKSTFKGIFYELFRELSGEENIEHIPWWVVVDFNGYIFSLKLKKLIKKIKQRHKNP